MIQGKIWGRTQLLLETPLLAIHLLTIKPGAKCSQHKHQYKFNCFLCLSGTLFIDVWKNDYKLVDTTELKPYDFMTVPPNEFHLFRTGRESAEAVEMYYLPGLSDDIIRKTVGRVRK